MPTSTWRATASTTSCANGPTTSPCRSRSSRGRQGGDRPTRARPCGASRNPRSATEQYAEFYRHVGMNFDKPWATLHWRAEGALEFSALLFVPGMKPFQAVEGERAEQGPPARPAHVHHRRGRAAAVLAALRPGRRRHRGPAPQRLARDAAGDAGARQDPPRRHRPRAVRARPAAPRMPRATGRSGRISARSSRKASTRTTSAAPRSRRCCASAPRPSRAGPRCPTTSSRMKDGQEAIYYLVADDADALAALAAARRLPRPRHRGAAALRPRRRVLAGAARHASRTSRCARSRKGGSTSSKFAGEGDAEARGAGSRRGPRRRRSRRRSAADVSDVRATDRLVESAVVLSASGERTRPADAAAAAPGRPRRRRHAGAGDQPAPPADPGARRQGRGRDDIAEAAGTLLDLARIQDGDTPRDPGRLRPKVAAALAVSPHEAVSPPEATDDSACR